jgi:hypothetical protein
MKPVNTRITFKLSPHSGVVYETIIPQIPINCPGTPPVFWR